MYGVLGVWYGEVVDVFVGEVGYGIGVICILGIWYDVVVVDNV